MNWGAGMSDDRHHEEENKGDEQAPARSGVPLKPAGEVVLTHLDSPPSSGKHVIHPRRPAPIVPTRDPERGDKDSAD
jgi:hypothetical protein